MIAATVYVKIPPSYLADKLNINFISELKVAMLNKKFQYLSKQDEIQIAHKI